MNELERHRKQYNDIESNFNNYLRGIEQDGVGYVEAFYFDEFIREFEGEESYYAFDFDPNDYSPGSIPPDFQPYFDCIQNIKSAIEKLFDSPSFEDHHQLNKIYHVIERITSVGDITQRIMETIDGNKDHFDTSNHNEWKEELRSCIYAELEDIEERLEEDRDKIDLRCNWKPQEADIVGGVWGRVNNSYTSLDIYSLDLFPHRLKTSHIDLIFGRVKFLKRIKALIHEIQGSIKEQLYKLERRQASEDLAFKIDCLENEFTSFDYFLYYFNGIITKSMNSVSQRENELSAKLDGQIGNIGNGLVLEWYSAPVVRDRENEEMKLKYYRRLLSELKSL